MTHPTHSCHDRIRLTGLSARGHHGVLPFEREEGQLFSVDLVLDLGERGTAVAAQTDSLDEAVDYSALATRVVAVIEGEPVNLIETLAERVADVALEHQRVRSVRVTVHKPQAPLSVAFDDVAVSIVRTSDADWDEAPTSASRDSSVTAPAPAPDGGAPADGGTSAAGYGTASPSAAPAPAPTSADEGPSAAAAGAPAPSEAEAQDHELAAAALLSSPVPAPTGGAAVAAASFAAASLAAEENGGSTESAEPGGAGAPVEPARDGSAPAQDNASGDGPSTSVEPAQVEGDEMARAVMSTPVSGAEGGLAAAGAAFAAADAADAADSDAAAAGPVARGDGASAGSGGASVYRGGATEDRPAGDEVARAMMSTPVSGAEGGLAAAGAAFAAADAADSDDAAAGPFTQERVSDDGGDDLARAVMSTPVSGADAGLASAGAAFAAAGVADAPAGSAPHGPATADSADTAGTPDAAVGAAPLTDDGPADDAGAPAGRLDARPEGRPAEVVIALGGNVGGVVPALRQAVATLRETDGVEVTSVAPLARTQAVTEEGAEPQPDFLNTVVLARTSLSPREVLDLCHRLEDAAGRVRTEHWGPRTLDADLVDYEGVTSDDAELTIPHPQASQRAFVLVPWSQADPFAEIGGRAVAALAEDAPDRDGVRWLALDWIDSDHLPALPTGQYVAPPAGAAPAPTDGDEDQGL